VEEGETAQKKLGKRGKMGEIEGEKKLDRPFLSPPTCTCTQDLQQNKYKKVSSIATRRTAFVIQIFPPHFQQLKVAG